jgi:hypothetical protein
LLACLLPSRFAAALVPQIPPQDSGKHQGRLKAIWSTPLTVMETRLLSCHIIQKCRL